MATFSYTALTDQNDFRKGTVEARSVKAATLELERSGLFIVNLQRQAGRLSARLKEFFSRTILRTISAQDRIDFTRNLLVMLQSGIALDEAVRTTADQTTNRHLQKVLLDIHAQVQNGSTLNAALGRHDPYFSSFYRNFIKIGESSGKLDDVLAYLLEQQEKDAELRQRVRGAMLYPTVIVVALIIMVTFMILFVIPRVVGTLQQYGVGLPLTTRILIGVSSFLSQYYYIAFPGLIAIIVLFKRAILTRRGKRLWDRVLLKIPYLSQLIIQINLARFTRAFAALLQSGIMLDKSLDFAADVPNNVYFKDAARQGIRLVRRGVPLTEVFNRHPRLYPPIMRRMCEVGERTGQVSDMIEKSAIYYEQSLERSLRNLSSIIEPLLLLTIGLIVGFVAVSILTPIWKFSDTI